MSEKIELIKEYFNEKKYLIGYFILILIIILILIYFFIFNNKSNNEVIEVIEENNIIQEEKEEECIVKVDIKGLVEYPGLYDIECEKRVNDVINLAGGLKNNADTSVINLGKKVFDQMVIIIYSNDDVKNFTKVLEEENIKEEKCVSKEIVKNDACVSKENKSESSYTITTVPQENGEIVEKEKSLININSATIEELMTLTGVGESKAKAIIAYREENGLFKSIEDIKNVTGIGDKMFEKIKNYITV